MTNNFPSQDYPFTGYRYSRKQVDIAKLWQSFNESQKQAAAYAEQHNIYNPAQTQPISEQKVNQYWESDLIKQENI